MFLADTTISKLVHFFVHIKCEVDLRTQKETRGGQSAMQLVLLPADKHTQTQREINIPPTSSVISLCHEYTHTSCEHSCILTMFVLCVCIKAHTQTQKTHTYLLKWWDVMFWFPLQTLCLCLHRGTPLLCVCLHIVLWVCSCAWFCNGKKVYGIKIILSFFNARPVIYCGYLELCVVSASVQCFFSPRFVHSFFHVWKTSNFYFTYSTYLLSLCLSWEMCLFICVCVSYLQVLPFAQANSSMDNLPC